MGLEQCCDVFGNKFFRDISKFCANYEEKRMKKGAVEEDVLKVQEGNMRGFLARFAL